MHRLLRWQELYLKYIFVWVSVCNIILTDPSIISIRVYLRGQVIAHEYPIKNDVSFGSTNGSGKVHKKNQGLMHFVPSQHPYNQPSSFIPHHKHHWRSTATTELEMASTAAVPFWRSAGMTYITYSNICANLVRNCLKEPHRSEAISREKVHFSVTKWADGKPQKPSNVLSFFDWFGFLIS